MLITIFLAMFLSQTTLCNLYSDHHSASQTLYHASSVEGCGAYAANHELIVIYTPQYGNWLWWDFPRGYEKYSSYYQCRAKTCCFTADQRLHRRAHVLLFHARDMPDLHDLKLLRQLARNPSQKWVYYTMESPIHVPNPEDIIPLFDYVISYDPNSDFPNPYAMYQRLSVNSTDVTTVDYFSRKSKEIAWFVSYCGGLRDLFVIKLMRDLQVDVYGSCSHFFGQNNSAPKNETSKVLEKYKFHLAFENSFCNHYITEKYWDRVGISVPIVMGALNYSIDAIPGSYISVHDFKAWDEFIIYIRKVSSDRDMYNSYFKWKSFYRVTQFTPNVHWTCRLCDAMRTSFPPLRRKLRNVTSKNENCVGFPDSISRWIIE